MMPQSLYLFELEPPADDALPYYVCELIRGVGSSASEEFAVRVTPPVVSGGVEYDELLLRGRWALYLPPDLADVDLGPSGMGPVYIAPLQGGSTFQPYLGTLADHLPEHVKRGEFWQWFCDAMAAFIFREGDANVPEDHVEEDFELGRHVAKLRRQHDYGILTADKRAYLESLPGWAWGDSPSSAVIRFTTALSAGDVAKVESLLCGQIAGAVKIDLGRPSTLGDLASFHAAWLAYSSKAPLTSIFVPSDTEPVATSVEQTRGEPAAASTDVEFHGTDHIEVWTLHTVFEDNRWKVCSAEFRDLIPYDPGESSFDEINQLNGGGG